MTPPTTCENTLLESSVDTLSAPVGNDVQTGPTSDDELLSTQANREGWRGISEDCLPEWWGHGVPEIEDEGLVSPSKIAVECAIRICRYMQTCKVSPLPARVVPSGDGGLVLEHWIGNAIVEKIVIGSNGVAELRCFKDNQLTERSPWVRFA